MRVELMLELSGLSRQESLVIKACTIDPSQFEMVAATLIEHYGSIHLLEKHGMTRPHGIPRVVKGKNQSSISDV